MRQTLVKFLIIRFIDILKLVVCHILVELNNLKLYRSFCYLVCFSFILFSLEDSIVVVTTEELAKFRNKHSNRVIIVHNLGLNLPQKTQIRFFHGFYGLVKLLSWLSFVR